LVISLGIFLFFVFFLIDATTGIWIGALTERGKVHVCFKTGKLAAANCVEGWRKGKPFEKAQL